MKICAPWYEICMIWFHDRDLEPSRKNLLRFQVTANIVCIYAHIKLCKSTISLARNTYTKNPFCHSLKYVNFSLTVIILRVLYCWMFFSLFFIIPFISIKLFGEVAEVISSCTTAGLDFVRISVTFSCAFRLCCLVLNVCNPCLY